MNEPPITTAAPYFPDLPEIIEDIRQVLTTGILMNGPFGTRFEEMATTAWSVEHAVALNSCTSALQIALGYLGAKDKTVLVSTNTYVATGNAVTFAGGSPAFCDVAPGRLCPGVAEYEAILSDGVVGVVHTHIAGIVDPEFSDVVSFCERNGLFLIEDCAHAHGARYGSSNVGSGSHAGCYSFYPTKILTTGTGGLLTTNDAGLDSYARSMRVHGRSKTPYVHDLRGNDWFMNEVTSVLAVHQMQHLDSFVERRISIAARYREGLGHLEKLSFFEEGGGRAVYYKLPVLLGDAAAFQAVCDGFGEIGVEPEPLYNPPCHLQPIFSGEWHCPNAEDVLPRAVCLPIHARLSDDDVDRVVHCVLRSLRAN
jgi:perosamine synthetase